MKKTDIKNIIREEVQKVINEGNINIKDFGYGSAYYNISSDILEEWNHTKKVYNDIKGYLEAAHSEGGPKLTKEIMDVILAAVKDSQPLLRTMRGSSEPEDVDLV